MKTKRTKTKPRKRRGKTLSPFDQGRRSGLAHGFDEGLDKGLKDSDVIFRLARVVNPTEEEQPILFVRKRKHSLQVVEGQPGLFSLGELGALINIRDFSESDKTAAKVLQLLKDEQYDLASAFRYLLDMVAAYWVSVGKDREACIRSVRKVYSDALRIRKRP